MIELNPTKYQYAEDIIADFGTSDSTKNHAWAVLPSRILGKLPEHHYQSNISYSKTVSILKKCGITAVKEALAGDWQVFTTVFKKSTQSEAITNFINIIGKQPNDNNLQKINVWSKFKNGRDLFIKGLGKFDIPMTITAIDTNHNNPQNWRLAYDPYEIMAQGYFGRTDHTIQYILKEKGDLYNHLIRWKSQWTEQLLGRLDEVRHVLRIEPANIKNLTPASLIAHVESRQPHIHNTNTDMVTPFKQKGITEIQYNGYSLMKVLTPQELLGLSLYLNNCLNEYNSSIRVGNCAIWGLYRDRELLGAGELLLKGLRINQWTQICGKNNIRLTAEQQQVFESALEIIT